MKEGVIIAKHIHTFRSKWEHLSIVGALVFEKDIMQLKVNFHVDKMIYFFSKNKFGINNTQHLDIGTINYMSHDIK